ncbi:MAG: DUF1553 domain-containing protein [Planctomycetales bacterium]|nr:DUF1553 domain-containing protein [Planctomycetales bacterium]
MRMMPMVTLYRALALSIFGLAFVISANADDDLNRVRFDRDIRPLLSDRCFHCHGPDTEQRQADLRLDRKDDAFAPRDGQPALTAGNLDQSSVWARISTTDESERMPPVDSNKKLTPAEMELIKRWIEQGAEWTDHWAFVAPKRPAVPEVPDSLPAVNPIDHFVVRRLRAAGLAPTEETDRRTLIRRVTLDLTGLPPTPDEVERFVNDKSATAYETVVDRLLQSPHFGERMAVMWLDAARYGDTSVFHADGPRDMWGWRDRVVRAYNENMPFDRFSILQLAGDLVPDAHVEDRMLAGFNRNNGTTDEGGAIAEEYRVEYVVDRVKTTSTVWLGLSMECGQCHDHKYDPISQEDYYRFYAFFNVSSDGGMQTRNGNAQPILEIPDTEKQARLPEIQQQLDDVEKRLADRRTAADMPFLEWVTARETEIAAKPEASTPTGMSLHFALDEGAGAEVTNLAQPDHKGKIEGQPEWVDGRLNKALKLNGSTYVDLGDVGRFERTDSVSYGGWIKLPKNGSGALLARMDDANSYRGYDCLISGGKIAPHIIHKWPENAIKVQTKKALEADKWHHVMVTYDGSSKAAGVTIYVDGEVWQWDVQQDSLSDTVITEKTLLIGSRHPSSRLTGEVDDIRFYPRLLSEAEVKQLAGADPILPILQLAAADRSDTQRETLFDYYLNNVDAEYQMLSKEQNGLRQQQIELVKPLTTVMIMSDMAKPRDTFMLSRGRYDAPTDHKVAAGTPAILPPMSEGMPSNRLGLAQWLFDDEHPLTARVAVNRYWQMLFGRGLVNTPDDFGSQGDFPTHPELLDWLAVDFRESGWNIKRMLKNIVMSHTYRQSSRVTPELWQRDPENRLLARGARFRLQGEFIRDQALAVSGLLNDRMGGPGVKPYQPPGLWAEVGLGGNPKFVQDHGEALYRRSLYTYWKRSAPPPNMQIFDAPTREKCQVKRARTNTPLQALVLLNDVQFVEAARHLAARIMQECSDAQPAKRIERGMLLTTARLPSETELRAFTELYEISLAKFQGDSEAANKLLGFGESKNVGQLDPAEHAAWTIVASTLMNLDETLVRN